MQNIDKENLAFFATNNKKYCFCVIPSVPTDAPGLYSAMINNFKYEWGLIFNLMLRSIDTLGKNEVSFTKTDKFYLNKTKLVSNSCTITD